MRTKIVYVLTCAENATYIEQALISIWSARHYNINAHIVLLLDNKTNDMLVGMRSEILSYISDCKVVYFDNDSTMMYRSRYIKTRVRSLVNGDILFVDSDTIINGSLAEIDDCPHNVAAVMESNLPIKQFHPLLYDSMMGNARKIGWNPEKEQYYFSSGVIYAKDTPVVHTLFEKWHDNWLEGLSLDIRIDQPSLAKANIECGRLIQPLENKWNCIMFTYPRWAKEALILHFAAYRNMSFLFSKRVLIYIKENGLTNYIKYYILHPTQSYIPFDSEFYHFKWSDICRVIKNIHRGIKLYAMNIDVMFTDFIIKSKIYKLVFILMKRKFYLLASFLIACTHFYYTNLTKKYIHIDNICAKL